MSKADRPDHPGAAERFNEESATYAVRGSDAPDLEAGVAAIRNVLKTLPVRPGVYRMQDARGDVLYVGKARALRNRVTNYTQVARLPKRLQRMVSQTRSLTIVTTRTANSASTRTRRPMRCAALMRPTSTPGSPRSETS